jgi:hypothetical protein
VDGDSPIIKKAVVSALLFFFPSQTASQPVSPHSLSLHCQKANDTHRFSFLFFFFFFTHLSLIPTPDPTDPNLYTAVMDILQCYHNSRLLVDWSDNRMWFAVASIIFNPTFWNIVARKGSFFRPSPLKIHLDP